MGDESSKYRGIIFFLAFLSFHIFFYTFLIARHMLDKKIDRRQSDEICEDGDDCVCIRGDLEYY